MFPTITTPGDPPDQAGIPVITCAGYIPNLESPVGPVTWPKPPLEVVETPGEVFNTLQGVEKALGNKTQQQGKYPQLLSKVNKDY